MCEKKEKRENMHFFEPALYLKVKEWSVFILPFWNMKMAPPEKKRGP